MISVFVFGVFPISPHGLRRSLKLPNFKARIAKPWQSPSPGGGPTVYWRPWQPLLINPFLILAGLVGDRARSGTDVLRIPARLFVFEYRHSEITRLAWCAMRCRGMFQP
jgi:hypothetical protein